MEIFIDPLLNLAKDNVIAFLSLLIAITALVVTWRIHIINRAHLEDEELLGQLILSLETSFSSLEENGRPKKRQVKLDNYCKTYCALLGFKEKSENRIV